ncbi:hypothetical protein ACFOYW_08275 [Gryllotalpicola reticulitermitis]|uniref:Uncharacterized protein n=1 Tax=Gryllotalpicola reticulitermitis TaxID=1184153 RepID=A0ABV8Q4L8_9MICO
MNEVAPGFDASAAVTITLYDFNVYVGELVASTDLGLVVRELHESPDDGHPVVTTTWLPWGQVQRIGQELHQHLHHTADHRDDAAEGGAGSR